MALSDSELEGATNSVASAREHNNSVSPPRPTFVSLLFCSLMRLSITVTGVRALADRSGYAAAPQASSPRISGLTLRLITLCAHNGVLLG